MSTLFCVSANEHRSRCYWLKGGSHGAKVMSQEIVLQQVLDNCGIHQDKYRTLQLPSGGVCLGGVSLGGVCLPGRVSAEGVYNPRPPPMLQDYLFIFLFIHISIDAVDLSTLISPTSCETNSRVQNHLKITKKTLNNKLVDQTVLRVKSLTYW